MGSGPGATGSGRRSGWGWQIPGRQSDRRCDIEQDLPVTGRLLDIDKSTQRAQQGHRERDEIRQGDAHFMVAAGQVMAEFMRAQDGQQADGEGQSRHQQIQDISEMNGS